MPRNGRAAAGHARPMASCPAAGAVGPGRTSAEAGRRGRAGSRSLACFSVSWSRRHRQPYWIKHIRY